MDLSAVFALLVAPVAGSFVGVLGRRLPEGEGIVFGRSRCPACGRRLAARDLVPLLSWALAGGRCRYCGARLGWYYPAVELAALALAAVAVTLFTGLQLWATCLLGWTLLALAIVDLRRLVLPDVLTLPLVPLGLAVAWLQAPDWAASQVLLNHALGSAFGWFLFAAVAFAYRRLRHREGLGPGDAKLMAAAGAWLGWQPLPWLILLAAVAALAVATVRRPGIGLPPGDRMIAFGPYLAAAFWLVWLAARLKPSLFDAW